MNATIREAREADYPYIEAIWQQVHTLNAALHPETYAPRQPILSQDRFHEHLITRTLLVADCEGIPVGILAFSVRNVIRVGKGTPPIIYIHVMAVDEAHRHQGIGRQLLDHIRSYAAENGFDGVELQVAAGNDAARAMYERYGFVEKSINLQLL